MSTLLVFLLIGATVRLTRLVTADVILEKPRAWVERRVGEKLEYLIRCPWCASWWVGLVVFLLGWYAPDTIVWIVSGALTASLVAGWVATLETLIEVVINANSTDGDE